MHKDHLGGGSIFKLNQKMFLKGDLQIWKVRRMCFCWCGPPEQCLLFFHLVFFLPLFLTLPNLVMSLLLTFDSVKKTAELLFLTSLSCSRMTFQSLSCLSLNCQCAFVRGGSGRWELLPGSGHRTCLGSNSCFPLHPLQ